MKSYVFYDDTADYEAYDDVRDYLFDLHGEDNGWETTDDVPDNWIYDEISEQNNADWRELLHDLGRVFKEDCYLLTGTCGRWCGAAQGGKFINTGRGAGLHWPCGPSAVAGLAPAPLQNRHTPSHQPPVH